MLCSVTISRVFFFSTTVCVLTISLMSHTIIFAHFNSYKYITGSKGHVTHVVGHGVSNFDFKELHFF